jgi:hypothetical protein
LLDDKEEAVTLKLFVVNVPDVTVTAFDVVKASCNVQVAVEGELLPIVIELTVVRFLPFDVMVYEPDVAWNNMFPVPLHVIAEDRVRLPKIPTETLPAIVPVNPVKFKSLQVPPPAAIVQVPVDRLVKKTLSEAVGTEAPPAPPDVVAHLVPAVASQLAVPPTQYLSAKLFSYRRVNDFFCYWWVFNDIYPIVIPFLFHGFNLCLAECMVIRKV